MQIHAGPGVQRGGAGMNREDVVWAHSRNMELGKVMIRRIGASA